STYTEYWTVYIDYNQNGKLNDAGELVASGSGTGLVSIAFKVPKSVLNGKTRMRVQMKYGSSSTDPCATFTSGEVEDYSVNIAGGISYCASAGTSTYYEYINNVKLGLINNTSGNNFGYKNYTNLSTGLTDGFSYTISLTPGFAFGPYTEYWNVYIDYNRNGLFTDAGEKVATATGSGLVSASFTIPFLTPTGPTRMRVQMSYGSAPLSPCSAISSGEVEDYSVNILPPVFGPVASTTSSEEVKVTETKTASVMVAPNPVKSANAQVLYTLKENGPATLKFIDLGGRTMQVENLGIKNAGSYTFNASNLDRLTSGSYFIVIEQNGRIAARNKFIVAK
ncbi:MAG: GEVED domain-containing protein, partial [Panacibacter sp.]